MNSIDYKAEWCWIVTATDEYEQAQYSNQSLTFRQRMLIFVGERAKSCSKGSEMVAEAAWRGGEVREETASLLWVVWHCRMRRSSEKITHQYPGRVGRNEAFDGAVRGTVRESSTRTCRWRPPLLFSRL